MLMPHSSIAEGAVDFLFESGDDDFHLGIDLFVAEGAIWCTEGEAGGYAFFTRADLFPTVYAHKFS